MDNYGFSPRAHGRRLAGYAGQSGRNHFEAPQFLRPQSSDWPSRLIGRINRPHADFSFVSVGAPARPEFLARAIPRQKIRTGWSSLVNLKFSLEGSVI